MSDLTIRWQGPIAEFFRDTTPELDLEGSRLSGKTTACLWKEHWAVMHYPGIWSFIGRFADGETTSKLCPVFEQICEQAGERPTWHADELYYGFRNGSRVYAFGLKAPDHLSRYAKLRGLSAARVYIDQTEEVPADFSSELRAALRQPGYPHQLTLSPNPPNVTHWLAKEFPEANHLPGRKYYHVSIYDNAHNLPAETLRTMEASFPVGHAKRRTLLLGLRGLDVIGEPVYARLFERARHCRPLAYNPDLPLVEAIDFGKHHPCWIAAQFPPTGGIQFLGGIQGQDLFLDEFIPIIQQHRAAWFPDISERLSCCDPAGAHQSSQGVRQNGVTLLKAQGFPSIKWAGNSNAPDVRLAMIERLGAYMTKRTTFGEQFGIDSDPHHWLRISRDTITPDGFLADGFEAGYVWDEHMVSVGSKQVRKARKDGWFEHGQNCSEYVELNFGAGKLSRADEEQARRKLRQQRDQQTVYHEPSRADVNWMV